MLWQLFEGPMHVYRMQKMFEAQGKDRVVNLRSRASLYQTIERLERHGLVEVYETRREEGYPDRVVYAITDAGREVARQWLREMLHNTEGEYPEFIAALSILFGLPPDEAQRGARAARGEAAGCARGHRALAGGRPGGAAASVPARGGVPQGAARGRAFVAPGRDRRPARRTADLE